MDVKILTLNVNGLNNAAKRRNLMIYCISKNCDFYLLQETHCCDEIVDKWSKEWQTLTRGNSLWNNGNHKKRGVAILTKKDLKINEISKDKCGRILAANFLLKETTVRIINIYGPNEPQQKENFFKSLENHARSCETLILSGDFNMVETPSLDRQGGELFNRNNTLGQNNLKNFTEKYEIIDIYRELNPLKIGFTYESPDKAFRSRIDRVYVSLAAKAESACEIYDAPLSDHKAVICEIRFGKINKRGPGYWHLNTDILKDEIFKFALEAEFESSKNNKTSYQNNNQWWDIFKYQVKETATERAKELSRQTKAKSVEIKEQIVKEKEKDNKNKEKIKNLEKQLLELSNRSGVFVRTKQTIVEEGETPSKALFQMEKNNQKKKTVKEVRSGDRLYKDTKNIQKAVRKFYKNLYKKQNINVEGASDFLDNIKTPLTNEENGFLNIKLSSEELLNAANSLATGKSPGIDGIPVEFYQHYWSLVGEDFTKLANENLFDKNNDLPWSQRTALISLLPKAGDLTLLQNWRPISLLCADYKIITKALALRLAKVLNKILEPSQTCSVPERDIYSNLFLTRDLIDYTNEKNVDGYLIAIDQEKAFDKIDRGFLFKILKKLNLGKNFVRAIKQTMKNAQSLIINNGYLSAPFKIERGVRQGDPISLMLYCIAVETLALDFKNNKKIDGIPLPGTKTNLKVMQYADDTTVAARDINSLEEIFKTLEKFERASGSNINKNKTKGLALGNFDHAECDFLLKQRRKNDVVVNWVNDSGLKILGITFFTDLRRTAAQNWQKAYESFKGKLKNFKYRNVSLRCKSIYVNTLALSKVWFVANVFPIGKETEKPIKKEISIYLWQNNFAEPIKRDILNLPVEKGGLGILNARDQCLALRTKHMLQIKENPKPHEKYFLQKYTLAFSLTNLAKNKCPQWIFLTENNYPKTLNEPPFYYKDVTDLLRQNQAIFDIQHKTSKNIYLYLASLKQNTNIEKSQRNWDCQFRKKLPWDKIWLRSFNSYAQGPSQNTQWKIFHEILPTKLKIHNWKKNRGRGAPNCAVCGQTENTLHPVLFCKTARTVWRHFKGLYEKLITLKPFNTVHAIFLTNTSDLSKSDFKAKLITTITNIITTELWRGRNLTTKENKNITSTKIIENVKREIKYIWQIKYNKLARENNIKKFHKLFSINNAVSNQNEEALVFTL